MADVFKKQITRYYGPDGKRCTPDTPGAVRCREQSRKWYGTVGGKAVPLCRDKQKSVQLLRKLQGDAELARHGLADPYAGHKLRPLADHLDDFAGSLRAKGDSSRHVALTLSRIRGRAERDRGRLAGRPGRGPRRRLPCGPARRAVDLPAGWESFRLSEVAALLGVNPHRNWPVIRRRS